MTDNAPPQLGPTPAPKRRQRAQAPRRHANAPPTASSPSPTTDTTQKTGSSSEAGTGTPGAEPRRFDAKKWHGGRPRIIPSPEEFDRRLDAYLEACKDADPPEPITLSGICLALGLADRSGLDNYGERPEFVPSVKRAKALVANAYERRLHSQACVGAIFALKNVAGWSDRQELNLSGGVASIDFSRLSDEQLARILGGEHPLAVLASSAPAPKRLAAGSGPEPGNP